jgi:hypothetical protein
MTSVTNKVLESTESIIIFFCEKCNYKTSDKSNYKKHCLTARHKLVTNGDNKSTFSTESTSEILQCRKCNKTYKSRNGLWLHSKNCSQENNITTLIENPVIDTNLIIKLIQQNENLQNLLVQQAAEHSQKQSELIHKLVDREPSNTIVNGNNNTTNNNQKFNLNFFLNETCKDAMNIQEFMENLRITFNDLLKIGDDGFVSGVTDIFIKELRELDINRRPIHCTDSKRDTIYLKENGEWNKDDKDKTKLKQLIEKVEYKNVAVLQQWCNDTPDSKINNSDNNLLRDKIYLQTLQGDDHTRDKIIKNISKEVIVDKE